MPTQVYDTPGVFEFPLAGRTNVRFEIFGSASGAAGGYVSDNGGSGGGAYVRGLYTPVGNETELEITVGSGGAGGSGGSDGAEGDICAISIPSVGGITVGSSQAGSFGVGGNGGVVAFDDFSWAIVDVAGGDGSDDGLDPGFGGGGGGCGGTDASGQNGGEGSFGGGNGGNGGPAFSFGSPGDNPGGGGGGSGDNGTTGGDGEDGKIIMEWDNVPNGSAGATHGLWPFIGLSIHS